MAAHEVVPVDDRRGWAEALRDLPHAFAHTWESCHAMRLTTGHPTFLYVFEGGGARIACALAEREYRGARDLVTPYGFGGFTGRGTCEDFPSEWTEWARARGYVCGYIGMNPLLEREQDHRAGEVARYNEVHAMDLRDSPEAMFARMSENRRREVRAWRPEDRLVDDRERLVPFLLAHYEPFMRGRGASGAYHFSPATWDALLASPQVLLLGSASEGAVESVLVLAWTNDVGDFLFGVSTPEGRASSAPLLWHGALRLRAMGVPWLNLGGGVRPGDGVARFKQRFGARALPLGAARQVYDVDRFRALCREAGVLPSTHEGYFPPYHAT